jgi:hypothetical protein
MIFCLSSNMVLLHTLRVAGPAAGRLKQADPPPSQSGQST